MMIAVGVGLSLGGILALSYYMNMKTPVPEGCESMQAACEGCAITHCYKNPTHQMEGE